MFIARFFDLTRPRRASLALALGLFLPGLWPAAQEPAQLKRSFDLPSDQAAKTFRLFSQQSGRGLIADADLVRGIVTNAVRGELTPAAAVDRMLVQTGLVAKEDPLSGAFVVYREKPGPNAQRAALN